MNFTVLPWVPGHGTPIKDPLPWEHRKFGWLEDPKTERSKYYNNILPNIYECCYGKRFFEPGSFKEYFVVERAKRWDDLKKFEMIQNSFSSNTKCWGRFVQQDHGRSKPQDIGYISQGIADLQRLQSEVESNQEHFKSKWEATYGSGNSAIKPGFEEESSYSKSVFEKHKTLRESIEKNISDLSEAKKQLESTYRGVCIKNIKITSQVRRKKENRAKTKSRSAKRKTERIKKFLSSVIINKAKKEKLCNDVRSLKDFNGFSQSLITEDMDTNVVQKYDKKSDLKTILEVLEICEALPKDIYLCLQRKKLELEDIHFGALDCKTPDTNTDTDSDSDSEDDL